MGSAKGRRATAVAKTRDKRREARVRQTQRAQERAASRQVSPRAARARRTIGWVLVGPGVLVGASHWLTHLGAWDFASQGIEDLVAGYPMAVLLGISGAVVLSR
jgi:hypothetical protein